MKRHDVQPASRRYRLIRSTALALLPFGAGVGCSSEVMRVPATESGQLIPPSVLNASQVGGLDYNQEVASLFPTPYRPILSQDPEGRMGARPSMWAWETKATKNAALAKAAQETGIAPPRAVVSAEGAAPAPPEHHEPVVAEAAEPAQEAETEAPDTAVAAAPSMEAAAPVAVVEPMPEAESPLGSAPGEEPMAPRVAVLPPHALSPQPASPAPVDEASLPPLPPEAGSLDVSPSQVAPPPVDPPLPAPEP